MHDDQRELARRWLSAAGPGTDACAALENLYARCAEEIARQGPACWASGRCCNFEQTGHRLYVTGLEAAYCVRRLPGHAVAAAPDGTPDAPARHPLTVLPASGAEPVSPVLTTDTLAGARTRGGCPFQRGNLCGVQAIKPLGCRIYFCDRRAQDWQNDLSERLLAELRALHERLDLPYRYGEWRGMLAMFVD
jgi:Fe-S-cluster containining protein